MEEIGPTQEQKRILIVDDSEDMRQLLQEILEEEENYTLFFADTGQAALDQAMQIHPDLILLDMSLPGLNGWEAATRLRRLSAFATTPIVAVTAHVSQADQERALAAGCSAHLGKPFDISAVLDIVERLLGK